MLSKLLISRIQTPDGTILTSRYRHDFVTHKDKNGLVYTLDGGRDYQRCAVNVSAPHKDISLYTDSPFTEIRQVLGRWGDNFNHYTLCKMSNEWLENAIVYNYDKGKGIFCEQNSYYMQELLFRQKHNIYIPNTIL